MARFRFENSLGDDVPFHDDVGQVENQAGERSKIQSSGLEPDNGVGNEADVRAHDRHVTFYLQRLEKREKKMCVSKHNSRERQVHHESLTWRTERVSIGRIVGSKLELLKPGISHDAG